MSNVEQGMSNYEGRYLIILKKGIHTSIFDIPCSTFIIQLVLPSTGMVTFCSMSLFYIAPGKDLPSGVNELMAIKETWTKAA